ncbi:hypothetical protein [Amnibacterium endophyticum]|uniref:Lipoprotein n=1 Tax=Amnibacterium endophyticum TaxID=2109337 RepID=A0ABW4LHX6_9MICO
MRRLVALLVVLGALATACSGPRYTSERLVVARRVPGSVGTTHLEGSVDYDSRGCVSVDGAVLVAPPGSSLIDDGIIVIAPSALHRADRQLQVGEPLTPGLVGVVVGPGSSAVPAAPDCGADRYFLIT